MSFLWWLRSMNSLVSWQGLWKLDLLFSLLRKLHSLSIIYNFYSYSIRGFFHSLKMNSLFIFFLWRINAAIGLSKVQCTKWVFIQMLSIPSHLYCALILWAFFLHPCVMVARCSWGWEWGSKSRQYVTSGCDWWSNGFSGCDWWSNGFSGWDWWSNGFSGCDWWSNGFSGCDWWSNGFSWCDWWSYGFSGWDCLCCCRCWCDGLTCGFWN